MTADRHRMAASRRNGPDPLAKGYGRQAAFSGGGLCVAWSRRVNEKRTVTGGAGFIGSNFVRTLLQNEPEVQVVNLDALTYAGSLENLRDLPHPNAILSFAVIFATDIWWMDCCTSTTSTLSSISPPNPRRPLDHRSGNLHSDQRGRNLHPARGCQSRLAGRRPAAGRPVRFHHVSTDEVFGTWPRRPILHRNHTLCARSPYAASKASSDHLVRSYFTTYGLPITITNCSNNYGPNQFPEKLIP